VLIHCCIQAPTSGGASVRSNLIRAQQLRQAGLAAGDNDDDNGADAQAPKGAGGAAAMAARIAKAKEKWDKSSQALSGDKSSSSTGSAAAAAATSPSSAKSTNAQPVNSGTTSMQSTAGTSAVLLGGPGSTAGDTPTPQSALTNNLSTDIVALFSQLQQTGQLALAAAAAQPPVYGNQPLNAGMYNTMPPQQQPLLYHAGVQSVPPQNLLPSDVSRITQNLFQNVMGSGVGVPLPGLLPQQQQQPLYPGPAAPQYQPVAEQSGSQFIHLLQQQQQQPHPQAAPPPSYDPRYGSDDRDRDRDRQRDRERWEREERDRRDRYDRDRARPAAAEGPDPRVTCLFSSCGRVFAAPAALVQHQQASGHYQPQHLTAQPSRERRRSRSRSRSRSPDRRRDRERSSGRSAESFASNTDLTDSEYRRRFTGILPNNPPSASVMVFNLEPRSAATNPGRRTLSLVLE